MDTPAEESKEPIVDNDSEPYPDDEDIPEEEEEDIDEEDDYPEEDLEKVRKVSNISLCSGRWVNWPAVLWFTFVKLCSFSQTTSIKTPEKREEEDTMPPYDAETQALIDG